MLLINCVPKLCTYKNTWKIYDDFYMEKKDSSTFLLFNGFLQLYEQYIFNIVIYILLYKVIYIT